jgi:uncharacterized protein YdhG (YjbR/CyaY superfamily)
MNARAKELAAEKRADRKRAEGEIAVRDAIDAMSVSDKAIAEKIHQLVTTHAPDLWPKTWYGMPAYARDGKVICFFQAAGKFDARYATFGFNDPANLDDGNMWATSFAILELNQTEQDQIVALIRRSVE